MSLAFFRKVEPEHSSGGPRKARPRIGIALGAGVARGWAHIGAMQELAAMGIIPDVIVGASIGAVVGGCFAAGRLEELEVFARSLTKRSVFSLLDISLNGGGLIGGDRLRSRLEAGMGTQKIEDLPIRFVAVATELETGHEIWLKSGAIVEAMRASYALPGVFPPLKLGGRWLFDGAIVNPVPVNVARAFGADRVIALSIGGDGTGHGTAIHEPSEVEEATFVSLTEPAPKAVGVIDGLRMSGLWMRRAWTHGTSHAPGLATVMANTFSITQDRITRSRLAGDPPDVLVSLKAGKVGLFEFHRADELIAIGRASVRKAHDDIFEALEIEPAET
jgi:NTE family protein